MEIKVDIEKMLKNVSEVANSSLDANIRLAARSIVSDLTESGKYHGRKKGLVYELMQKKIEDYVLSDAFSEMLDRLVLEEAEAQGREAVKSLLNSKARKRLFNDEFKRE